MDINEKIVIGRLGQQPMHIAEQTVDPQHATLTKTGKDEYVLEDNDSSRGVFVFGIRIKRKTINEDTPIFLGTYKTTVKLLLRDASDIDLDAVWASYNAEKRKWDRWSTMVNSIRMLTPIVTMLLTQVIGQNFMISAVALVVVMAIAMVAGEKVMKKKEVAMAELNSKMQLDYQCPHCHKFLGFTPYSVLKANMYCQYCGVPLK